MKLKDFAIFITIFLFIFISASPFKIRDDLEVTGNITSDSNVTADTFFGVLDGIDTMIDTVSYADTALYAKAYLNDSAYADTSGRALQANNADSLGHRISTGYLKNVMDTTAGIFIGNALDNWLFDSGYLWVRLGETLFSKYGGEELSFLDSSATYSRTSIQRGKVLLKDNAGNKTIGMITTGIGITNKNEDSAYVGIDTMGIYFSRYADQQVYSQFGLNNLTLKDTTGGSGAYIFGVKKDSINMLTKKSWLFNNLIRMNYGIYVDSSSTFANNLTINGNLTVNRVLSDTVGADLYFSFNRGYGDTLTADSINSNRSALDTIVNLKTTSDHSTIDTAIIDTAKIRGLYVQQGAEVDSGLLINGTDVIGLYVNHGNSIIYDDVTIIYKDPYYQSYFGILDPRDSNAWLQTANDLRLYKQGITGSVFTDSLWLRIDSTGYKVIKYGTTDTTARLQNGYVYALDSIKTGAIKSKSGTDSTLITDGTILLTDSIIGSDSYLTGFNKIASDSFLVGDNVIRDNGTYVYSDYIQANTLNSSYISNATGAPIRIQYNASTNPLIRWIIYNSDASTDTSLVEDSAAAVNGTKGRIRAYREFTFKQPTFHDSLATFGKVTVNNMFKLAEGRFKDDTVFMLTDTFTTFTNGMQFIDTTGDDSLYTRVRATWIKQ